MSNITENLLVKGARGNVAKQFVYKTEGNKTHIVKMPKVGKRTPNDTQIGVRDFFAAASRYGRNAIASAELGAAYKKKAGPGKRAFGIAFKDYMTPPKVRAINTLKYSGAPGSVIVVDAKDDFKVATVRVSIYDSSGVLLEEGLAIQNPLVTEFWNYTATKENSSLTGSVVKAIATDYPGNENLLEVTL